jgi:hypothetical protein
MLPEVRFNRLPRMADFGCRETIKLRTRIASPGNVPQGATVASLKMFPLPHAAARASADVPSGRNAPVPAPAKKTPGAGEPGLCTDRVVDGMGFRGNDGRHAHRTERGAVPYREHFGDLMIDGHRETWPVAASGSDRG